jgi:hypothetical protein
MAILLHEAWVGADGLPACCLAGPMGEAARKSFAQDGLRLVWKFEAGSYFEAMTKFNERFGYEPYASDQPWDREPYSDEWLRAQRGA